MEGDANKYAKLINLDHCSIFRSELIAIYSALKSIDRKTDTKNIWILTDSKRISVQHFLCYQDIHDENGTNVLKQLTKLSQKINIYFQWMCRNFRKLLINTGISRYIGKSWNQRHGTMNWRIQKLIQNVKAD